MEIIKEPYKKTRLTARIFSGSQPVLDGDSFSHWSSKLMAHRKQIL
jgi:hypothetical protein